MRRPRSTFTQFILAIQTAGQHPQSLCISWHAQSQINTDGLRRNNLLNDLLNDRKVESRPQSRIFIFGADLRSVINRNTCHDLHIIA